VHRGEDLTQEAFARIFARRKEWVPSAKFSTFVWRVALNLCYDELRRRERRRELSLESESAEIHRDTASPDAAPDAAVVREETAQHVRAALLRIPETYRAVLILRHYEDLKFREIADVLDIPEGTVKSRMAEGLTLLARLLANDDRVDIARSGARKKDNEVLVL
jgi:RNA polymerase sigma-70 factor, ECF subfamily